MKPTAVFLHTISGLKETFHTLLARCEGAYEALLQGDTVKHDEIVKAHLIELMQSVQAAVLAQASTARIGGLLAPLEKPVPVLSSPEPAMRHLASLLLPAGGSATA